MASSSGLAPRPTIDRDRVGGGGAPRAFNNNKTSGLGLFFGPRLFRLYRASMEQPSAARGPTAPRPAGLTEDGRPPPENAADHHGRPPAPLPQAGDAARPASTHGTIPMNAPRLALVGLALMPVRLLLPSAAPAAEADRSSFSGPNVYFAGSISDEDSYSYFYVSAFKITFAQTPGSRQTFAGGYVEFDTLNYTT